MQITIDADDLDEDIIEMELDSLSGYVEAALNSGCVPDEMIVVLQMMLQGLVELRGPHTLH